LARQPADRGHRADPARLPGMPAGRGRVDLNAQAAGDSRFPCSGRVSAGPLEIHPRARTESDDVRIADPGRLLADPLSHVGGLGLVRGVPICDVVERAGEGEPGPPLRGGQRLVDRLDERLGAACRVGNVDQLDVLPRREQRLDHEVDVQARVERPKRVVASADRRNAVKSTWVAFCQQDRDRRARRLSGRHDVARLADVRIEPVKHPELVLQRILDLVAGAAVLELRRGQGVAVLQQARPRSPTGRVDGSSARSRTTGSPAAGSRGCTARACRSTAAVPRRGSLRHRSCRSMTAGHRRPGSSGSPPSRPPLRRQSDEQSDQDAASQSSHVLPPVLRGIGCRQRPASGENSSVRCGHARRERRALHVLPGA
jgi:hypothetical protein